MRLLSKRRNSRAKIVSTAKEQPRGASQASNTADEAARERSSVRKIQSMDISRLKRRIVETMKRIASPRRKKDTSSRGSTLLERISRLLATDSTVSNTEERSSNVGEQLYRSSSGQAGDDTTQGAAKRTIEDEKGVVVSLVKETEGWRRISLLFFGNRDRSSSPARRKSSSGESIHGPVWKRTVHAGKLCTSTKVTVNPCRRADWHQTEPLVAPESPDSPGDSSETRSQASDLTVLLSDS